MRMPTASRHKTPARPVLFAVLAGSVTAVLVAFVACTSPDGVTPTCTPNVDGNGIHGSPDGCEQFAVCAKGPPAACCTGGDGGPLTGNDLATCLYGYGGCAAICLMPDCVTVVCSATACGATCANGGGGGGGGGTGGGGTGGSAPDGGGDGG